jgi:hypothetical protein
MKISIRSINLRFGQRQLLIAVAMVLCAVQGLTQASPTTPVDTLATQFQTPPDSAKPLAYWWWLNGHTDAATITSDLEAMHQEGYGGAILMDGNGSDQGGNIGVTPGPTFGSDGWRDLFLHTLKEAKRLGLRISLTTQSGWNVGGPTVTGEQSAKLLTWTRKAVHGPLKGSLQIDVPGSKNGFYRDIAVRAYPLRHGAALAGEDARKPIRNLKEKAVFVEAGFSVPDSKPLLADFPSVAGEEDLDVSQEVDLTTKKMSFEGKLEWDVPAGDWEILRIGYTSSNARVSTSSGAFQGLVIDYLDRDALTAFWNTNVQPLLTASKPYLGTTLKHVYTDSWEVGGVNWTGRFREAFIAGRGYDPLPYLPIVAGRIVNSRETSDRFLNDFRRTIGDLVLSEHYQTFGRLAAKNGLGFHPESGGPHGAPIDSLRVLGASTFPQTEFWAPSKVHRSSDMDRFFEKEASSAAHIYGKTLVAGEGLTSIGPQWEESPGMDLKPAFDQAVCEGLNLIVWHNFTSSPKAVGLPGQEYFAGTHFNPNVTWFRDGKSFFDYMGRVQFMMQQGVPVSDVLYYYGDQVPNFVQYKGADPAHVLPGYDYDVLDEDVLTNGLSVVNHRIRLANGTSYRELVLPPLTNISMPALKAIDRLVNAGATVVGSKPTHLTGLSTPKATDADVVKMADRLWAGCDSKEKNTGRVAAGKVVCTQSARQALEDAGVAPDLSGAGPAPNDGFDYVHRRAGGREIYFVRNTRPNPVATVLSFRVHGLAPEIWTPETGVIVPLSLYAETADGRTSLPVLFTPYGSTVLVFRKIAGPNQAPHIVRLERDGHEVFPNLDADTASLSVDMRKGRMMLMTDQSGHYLAVDEAGKRHVATVTKPTVLPLDKEWTLTFTRGWGAPSEVRLDKLESWSESKQEGIRHYSGTATYSGKFEIPSALKENEHVEIDLGEVRETARVSVNGKEIGVLWKRPFMLDMTSAAKVGTNSIKIQVTNLWPNRLIGDQGLPEGKRFTHTNITKFKADTPLLPSGLLGPARLRITTSAAMTLEHAAH